MRTAAVLASIVIASSCSANHVASYPSATLAIAGANVVTMTSAQPLSSQTVLIAGDRIVAIGAARDVAIPPNARVIDGHGLWLMPGLADMHVHMSEDDVPLFLTNGVTTVRELNGTPTTLALRDAIARGEKTGPRMIVSGPLLAGVKQRWRHRLITTPAEGTTEVEDEVRAGYDEIKIYDGLTAATYAAIADAARKGNKRFVGHVPADVGIANALAAGQSTIEHAETFANAAGHPPDPAKLPEYIALLRQSHAWFTPTLGVGVVLTSLGSDETNALFASVPLDLVNSGIRQWWESLRDHKSGPNSAKFGQFERDFVHAASDARVPMLFGTDTPNPLIVPGFGIHVEAHALAAAGLTPYKILQMMTSAPARYLGEEGKFGVVAPGAFADLVLLDANPLLDVANLRKVHGVVLRGRWLDRATLDNGVSALRERLQK